MNWKTHLDSRPLTLAACARWGALALATVVTTGCSVLQEERVDYKSARQVDSLVVPPDLTQLAREPRFAAPGGVVSATGFELTQPQLGVVTAATQLGDVRIERAGSQRWLVVQREPEVLWPVIRDFWQENGFLLTQDQQQMGLMETDWAENRAKLPQDFIRAALGRLFENLYSTGERDRFRTRLERNPAGGTEIYISHRGMIEVVSGPRGESTVWQPRPADPELEAEFLRRLMVKLGVSQEQTQALLAAGAVQPAARLTSVNNLPVVQLDEGFDRAWRRVGLALDRTGFTVEDRNRAQGVYYVRYVAPEVTSEQARPGIISRVFGGGRRSEAEPVRYRLVVHSTASQTTVSVLDAQGQPESSANAQRILQVIADDLK